MSTELDELETDLSARPEGKRSAKIIRHARKMQARPRPKWKHQLAMSKMAATKAGKK